MPDVYLVLQTPTPAQERLIQLYDGPPYVPASSAGSIPFIDFADQYVVSGATFDVGVLQGRSWQSIAASLADTGSDQARAILGSANVLAAAACAATDNAPATVCDGPAVRAIESTLAAAQPPA